MAISPTAFVQYASSARRQDTVLEAYGHDIFAGDGYRMLLVAEMVQHGDEHLMPGRQWWEPVHEEWAGGTIQPGTCFMRRKLRWLCGHRFEHREPMPTFCPVCTALYGKRVTLLR